MTIFLVELPELRDIGMYGLGLEKHPGADPDAFDLVVMKLPPEGRTRDPQGPKRLFDGE